MSKSTKLGQIVIPEYFMYMRNDSLLNARDVCDIFGYSNANHIGDLISTGSLPEPDRRGKLASKLGTCTVTTKCKLYWTKLTIVNEINRRNNLTRT